MTTTVQGPADQAQPYDTYHGGAPRPRRRPQAPTPPRRLPANPVHITATVNAPLGGLTVTTTATATYDLTFDLESLLLLV
jgi:hypothetical protein